MAQFQNPLNSTSRCNAERLLDLDEIGLQAHVAKEVVAMQPAAFCPSLFEIRVLQK